MIYRMVCDGWKKEELLDFIDSDLDYAIDNIAEFENEDVA